jgi:hypothetical protein
MVNRFAASKARIRDRVLTQVHGALHRVVIIGSGDLAEMAFHALESARISVIGICDFQDTNVGRDWCGRKILDPSQILYLKPDGVIIADTRCSAEVYGSLKYLSDYGIHVICLGARSPGRNGGGGGNSGEDDPAPPPGELVHSFKGGR